MKKNYAIGADIGGSHISAAVVDLENRQIINETRSEQKVDNKASAREILDNWANAIANAMEHIHLDELEGTGFAMPGPFDYNKGIALMDKSVDKYENLYGINVGDELKKRLELSDSMPFRYLNDALAFAVGECWFGKASKYHNVVAVTLGTGFGSAFITNGVPVIEGDRVPEKGYVYRIPYKQGIADDYFSTRWFISEFKKRTGIVCEGVKEIAEYKSRETEVRRLFHDFGNNIGNFLGPILSKFNAGCLVIGGNITGAWALFGPSLNSSFERQNISLPVLISDYMETAAIAGSGRLLDKEYWNKIEPVIAKI